MEGLEVLHALNVLPENRMRYLAPLLALALWCSCGNLRAGISAPIPFARISDDESRILVIRSGDAASDHPNVTNPTLSDGEEIDFLALFPASGVYRWPDRDLIYEITWYCLDRELLASADLDHLARINRFGNEWALKFYSSGGETNTYTLDRLLTAFSSELFRQFATWDWHHPWHDTFELRGEKVVVSTVAREAGGFPIGYHETHTFDLATGSLDRTEFHNERFVALLAGLTGGLIFLLTTVVWGVRARRKPPTQNNARQATASSSPAT